MKRLGSILLLLALVGAPPVLLTRLGFYAFGQLNVLAPADFRVLLAILTVVGWLAWAVFLVALAAEVARVASRGRIAVRLPGFGPAQAIAATLLAAVLASAAVPAVTGAVTMAAAGAMATTVAAPAVAAPAASGQEASADTVPMLVHMVAEGDDLWSLSERYLGSGSDWRRIVEANPDVLAADPTADLAAGTPLVIPAARTAAVTLEAASGTGAASVGGAHRSATERYTVRRGDTLWHLAQTRLGDGARYPELVALNRALIKNPDHIETGWVLTLPVAAAPDTPPPPPAPVAPAWRGAGATATDADAPAATQGRGPAGTGVASDEGQAPVAAPVGDAAGTTAAPGQTPAATPAPASEGAGTTAEQQASQAPAPAPVGDAAGTTAAPGQIPATPAQAQTEGVAESAFDQPAVRLALGGLAALAASGVIGRLLLHRRDRSFARGLGQTFAQPDAGLRRLETALGIAAAPGQVELIARAMRLLAAQWWSAGVPAPQLRRAVLDDTGLEFEFTEPVSLAPPFRAEDETRVRATWRSLRSARDVPRGVAYPGLVTLGRDAFGRAVMIDSVTWGVLAVDGRRTELAQQSLSAMVLELTCSPWSDELSLTVVTHEPEFVEAAALEAARATDDAEGTVLTLERHARERHALLSLGGTSYEAVRLDPDKADAWRPLVVVFEEQPDPDLLTRLRIAAGSERLGLAALVPSADAGETSGRLTLAEADDAPPDAVLEPADVRVAAQTIRPETRAAITRLVASGRSTRTLPASWWREREDDMTPERAGADVVHLHPTGTRYAPDEAAPSGPRLRLFGEVRLEGARGRPPERAQRRCLEYCAWLLDHPGATASEMTAALFVTDGTRRSNLSRLRGWLGETDAGSSYLPEAYSGRIALDDSVTSDWSQLRALLSDGVNRASSNRLRRALALVAGPPLADAAPGEWTWAEGLRTTMGELVRDAAVVLARTELERGDAAGSEWAARQGLLAAPGDELLTCELMRVLAHGGRIDEARAAFDGLVVEAASRGVDLRPETVASARELLRRVQPAG